MLNRTISKIVEKCVKQAPVVLLTGPRQVGKTTLLTHLFKNNSFKYISLDDPMVMLDAKTKPKDFLIQHKYPLIIDEVQKAPELLAEINSIVNKSKVTRGNDESNGMYILSGSNRKELMENSSESLAGRMLMIDMWPLSLNEIFERDIQFFDVDETKLKNRADQLKLSEAELFKYILKGFMPGLYGPIETDLNWFYSSYIQSILEKDLFPIINIKEKVKFIEFIKLLASNIGQELVYDTYAKALQVSPKTIKSWIDSLVKAKIIYLLKPYNEFSFSKKVVKRPKMYFFDTGLAAHLLGIDSVETLLKSYLKGRFFECFVMNELMKSFELKCLTNHMYYYRDEKQHEVDLVYLSKGKINCIEIKCGSSFSSKDIASANQFKNSKFGIGKKIIICSGTTFAHIDDVLVIPATAI